jgi:hypothetical protein
VAELAGHTNRVYTMLHVFDDCAHEHYQRTPIVAGESHNEHSTTAMKRKVAANQRAGQFKQIRRKKFVFCFNRRTNNRIR